MVRHSIDQRGMQAEQQHTNNLINYKTFSTKFYIHDPGV